MFRWLLRAWLHRAAHETVKRAAAEAAERHAQSPPRESSSTCQVGIVFALDLERDGLKSRCRHLIATEGAGFNVVEGLLSGRRVAMVTSGVGENTARNATEALLGGHRPAWVVAAGLAGGLVAGLRGGDVVMADEIVHPSGRRLSIDLNVSADALADRRDVRVGRLLTVDRPILSPEEKRTLGEKFSALAVDMESMAVADVCRRQKVRFLAIRAISDTVDEKLPPFVERFAGHHTAARRAGAVVGTVFRRPAVVKEMLWLRERTTSAADRLGAFLEGVVVQLVASIEPEEPE